MGPLVQRTILLGFLVISVACQPNRNANMSDGRIVRGVPSGSIPSNPSIQPVAGGGVVLTPSADRQWGEIQSSQLEAQARLFVSAVMDPSQLGPIQAIRFWGDVALANGMPLSQAVQTSSSVAIHSSSRLVIAIYDAYVGQTNSSGVQIQPVYTNISPEVRGQASGTIQGSVVRLRFQDAYGYIDLVGQLDQQYFRGEIRFQNSGSSAGGFEQFVVPTCGFFRC
jgi:hypothetical protein